MLTELSQVGFKSQIEHLAAQLHSLVLEKRKFAKVLRSGNSSLSSLPEKFIGDVAGINESQEFIVDVPACDLNRFTCAGVDGGIQSASLLGVDILLVRAVAAVISYTQKGIYSTSYFRSRNPQPKMMVSMERFSTREFENIINLRRTYEELDTALELISDQNQHIDLLLMDGSLTTSTYFVYSENSLLKPLADNVLATMRSLIETSQKRGILLAFVVKDSRSSYFVEFMGKILPLLAERIPGLLKIAYRRVLRFSRDQDFMSHLLRVNTRSFCLRKGRLDLPGVDSSDFTVYSFYIKGSAYDSPLRIEFAQQEMGSNETIARIADATANKISTLLLPLSQFHAAYALPAPIIEADARACLPNHAMDLILQMLRNRAPLLETTRKKRERNPFKF